MLCLAKKIVTHIFISIFLIENCFLNALFFSTASKFSMCRTLWPVYRFLDELEKSGLLNYPGGVPATLFNTTADHQQQWDFPNVWPPMVIAETTFCVLFLSAYFCWVILKYFHWLYLSLSLILTRRNDGVIVCCVKVENPVTSLELALKKLLIWGGYDPGLPGAGIRNCSVVVEMTVTFLELV